MEELGRGQRGHCGQCGQIARSPTATSTTLPTIYAGLANQFKWKRIVFIRPTVAQAPPPRLASITEVVDVDAESSVSGQPSVSGVSGQSAAAGQVVCYFPKAPQPQAYVGLVNMPPPMMEDTHIGQFSNFRVLR